MRKAERFRILAVWLVIMIVALGAIGGITLAKYLTKVDGEDSQDIANWTFKVNDNVANSEEFKLQLIPKEYENVKPGEIAPGTGGSFTISCSNGSDVDAKYKIDFTAEGKPQNLKFYYDAQYTNEIYADQGIYKYNFEKSADANDGKLLVESADREADGKETVVIYWFWSFYSGDDYADNIVQGTKMYVNATVTGQQITPIDK